MKLKTWGNAPSLFAVAVGFSIVASETVYAGDSLTIVDLSTVINRHVLIAQGTEKVYKGHPTTLLLPDGKTMFCVWTHGHGGTAGPLKRSEDGGSTWSDELPVPENWWTVKNCPALYRLTDPQGVSRIPDGRLVIAFRDMGRTLKVWEDDFAQLKQGRLDAEKLAVQVYRAESTSTVRTSYLRREVLLRQWQQITTS